MPETAITRRFNVRIPLRDGITLAADLVRPEPGPAPVVIMRTPYGRSGERQSGRATTFARAGYAFMYVDVRGRGDSDGSFEPYRNDEKPTFLPPARVSSGPRRLLRRSSSPGLRPAPG